MIIQYNKKNIDSVLIILLYSILLLGSIVNLGILIPVIYVSLFFILINRRLVNGLVILILLLYVPQIETKIPNVYFLTTIVFAFFALIKNKHINFICIKNKFVILFFLFVFLRSISVVFVTNMNFFSDYLMSSLISFIYIIPTLFALRSKNDVPYVLRWWGIIGALACLTGFLHFYLHDIAYINSIQTGADDILSKTKISFDSGWTRWIWIGPEPNFYALTLLIPFCINFVYLLRKFDFFTLILSIFSYLAILGTYSRSSLIIASLVAFVLLLLTRKRIRYIMFLPLVPVMIFFVNPNLFDRFNSINSITEDGGNGRTSRWEEALGNFYENPIWGIGTGQTRIKTDTLNDSHNTYLQILAESGIFAFSTFVFMMFYLIRDIYRERSALYFERTIYLCFMSSIFAIILNMNSISMFDIRVIIYLSICFYYYRFCHE